MKKLLLTIFCCSAISHVVAQGPYDSCADAFNDSANYITSGGTFLVDAINGSEIPSPVCALNGNGASNGEWYVYTPTFSQFVTITADSDLIPGNNGKDTRVNIYTGSCGSLVCHAGDDDAGAGFTSEVGFDVVAGETYYIGWDDRWDNSGFEWRLIEGTPPPPPPPITFQSFTVSNTNSDRAAVDMNNDHLDDLVSVSSTSINISYQLPPAPPANAGDPPVPQWNYVSIPTSNADNTPSWSLAAGDFDGNGYNDLLYAGGGGVTFMKANSNGTAYTEISFPEYVFSQRSNFIDINNDGHLDAFVCHDVAPNVYYLNDGSGNLSFRQGASTEVLYGLGTHASGGNYGTVWIDYDNDRDMDMFIAKCRGGNVSHKWNELWQNDGSGTYINVADGFGYYGAPHNNSSNLGDPVQTWSSAWADFDNDGDMDVFVGASSLSDGSHKLMRNNGDTGTYDFTDVTAGSGVSGAPTGIENIPADFDNDGFVDILTNGNVLFNNGDMTFTLISSGMPPSGCVGDFNDDGFLDVFNGNVRVNKGNSNHWLKLNLVGDVSNINGIGARVEINSPGLGTQIRDVRSGEGFRYMSSLNTHFGLGSDTTVNTVTIYWPSGTVDVVLNPAIDSTITVVEGETLSLEQSMVEDLILYPNPTKELLNLNASYGFENALYTIFDINGRMVMNSRFNSSSIDVSNLSSGNYILRIMDQGRMASQKFIKQ